MIRTQIQLTDRQAFLLKEEARKRGVSVAELIRQGVDTILDGNIPIDRDELRRRALSLSGKFHSGLPDLSVNHDKYLAEDISSQLEDEL